MWLILILIAISLTTVDILLYVFTYKKLESVETSLEYCKVMVRALKYKTNLTMRDIIESDTIFKKCVVDEIEDEYGILTE